MKPEERENVQDIKALLCDASLRLADSTACIDHDLLRPAVSLVRAAMNRLAEAQAQLCAMQVRQDKQGEPPS